MSVEISVENFAAFTESPDSAWNKVEGRVLDFVLKSRFKDHFIWLNNKGNELIPATMTSYGSWIPEDFRALDLGSGTGRVPRKLIEFGVHPSNIVAIDNNPKMLNHPHFPSGVNALNGDMREVDRLVVGELPKFGNFNLVTANMSLHYFSYKDLVRVLRKVRKLMTSDSYLYIMVPHPLRDAVATPAQYHQRGKIFERTPWGDEISLYKKTIDDYGRVLEDAGFDCGWLSTTGENLKIEDNFLIHDEGIRDTIREIRRGNITAENLPHFFRMWMLAFPI